MSMSIITADAVNFGSLVTCTQSVTLATNDVLLFNFSWRVTGSANFPTWNWNGSACTIISTQTSRNVVSIRGYIKATAGATANLVSATSPTQSQGNLQYVVVRSATNAMLPNPIKSFASVKVDTETPYALPSVPITGLIANDLCVSFLDWLGWDKDFANTISTTAAPASPLSLSDSVQNSVNLNAPGRAYLSTATGLTGSQSFTHTRTGSGNCMYNAAIVVLYESLVLIDDINGAFPIYSGQAAIPFSTTGFIANEITSATTDTAGVTVSGIVNNGDGTGTIDVSDMADGVAYPILPATIEFTFGDGTNTATLEKTLELEAGWETVVYENAFPLSDRTFCWYLDQAGISIADGTRVTWETISGFAFTAAGGTISDAERTVLAKVRPIDTGIMSFWTVTINEAGEVVSAESSLTAAGLVSRGLVARGLVARGL